MPLEWVDQHTTYRRERILGASGSQTTNLGPIESYLVVGFSSQRTASQKTMPPKFVETKSKKC
jgi:hypothetical protein